MMLNQMIDGDLEHDLMNGRYCIECSCELDGDIPMHIRFCEECAVDTEQDILNDFISNRLGEWHV